MDIFSIFFSMEVCCVFSLESPHWGDSNEYTQYTIFNRRKKITLNYPKSAAMSFCAKGLKNGFETAVVNEPSLFEPLKFYCTYVSSIFQRTLTLLRNCKVAGWTLHWFTDNNALLYCGMGKQGHCFYSSFVYPLYFRFIVRMLKFVLVLSATIQTV